MFNRRILVALAACSILSASTALAGGGGGTKKDSTIKVINNVMVAGVGHAIYAFVDVADADIAAAAGDPDPNVVFAAFDALGGKKIQPGGNSATFSVKKGPHTVTAVDIVAAGGVGKKPGNTTYGNVVVAFP